jgi:uncharacterized membrane protein YecN with MAPEG domain
MPIPTVTALYASINAIYNVVLANNVSTLRRRDKVSIGTGESKALHVAVRIHANNAEAVPLVLLLLLLAELCGGASLWLHLSGGLLFAARVAHAYGMPKPAPNPARVLGVATTWGLTVGLAVWLIVLRRG